MQICVWSPAKSTLRTPRSCSILSSGVSKKTLCLRFSIWGPLSGISSDQLSPLGSPNAVSIAEALELLVVRRQAEIGIDNEAADLTAGVDEGQYRGKRLLDFVSPARVPHRSRCISTTTSAEDTGPPFTATTGTRQPGPRNYLRAASPMRISRFL